MKQRFLVSALVLLGTLASLGAPGASAQVGPPGPPCTCIPGPSAGTKLAGGLSNPRGIKVGPDGMLYVAEAGTGGTTVVGSGADQSMSGLTGRISKIDPATGTVTTVAANLPSNAGPQGDAVGPADVAFLNGQLYYVQTHGGAAFGFPSTPTGVYKVNSNGTVTFVADIGAFTIANPPLSVRNGNSKDIEIGGNPYSMTVRDGAFYVVDGNQNQVLKVTTDGKVSRLAEFAEDITTTGIAFGSGGPLFVSTLGGFPFAPADGRVYSVGYPTGNLTQIASGFSSLTDVAVSGSGKLYALQFGDQASSPNGPPWAPSSGKVLRVNADGTMTSIVERFTFATSMTFSGDTLYVVNNGLSALAPGEVWSIPDFSLITPIPHGPPPGLAGPSPAAPAASPASGGVIRSGVTAPNTGTGPDGGDRSQWWLLVFALGALGLSAFGAVTAMKRP
jgi:hypothetical protein